MVRGPQRSTLVPYTTLSRSLLALTVRLPYRYDAALVGALRDLTAAAGSEALDALGVAHLLAGNVIETAGRRLLVEDACSGVNSDRKSTRLNSSHANISYAVF